MHCFEKKILKTCVQHQLFSDGDRVVVAVSGGVDSVALLHVLSALSGQLGISLVVAHVNHGLRPSEDTDEEQLVQQYASALGLVCYSASFAVGELSRAKRLSLEEAAREVRYSYFKEVFHLEHAAKICVAHHADDQAEEVLLRLIRGAGRKGLSGMDFIRDGEIVRPLLSVSKAEIIEYLQDRSIAWLDDSSNASLNFLRNRVRLELLPFLKGFNPAIADTLRRTAGVLKEEDVVLDEIATEVYGRSVKHEAEKSDVPARLLLDLNSLAPEHIAIRRRVAEKALIQMKQQPSFKFITEIIELQDKKRGSLLHLPRGLRVVRQSASLEFSYPRGITSERGDLLDCQPFMIEIGKPGVYTIASADMEICVDRLNAVPCLAELKGNDADYFDHEQLSFPFTVRNRLPGDRFTPLGGKGTKKVARLLSDLKIEPMSRDLIPVIVVAGEIAGVLGHCMSQRFRIHSTTRQVLKIQIKQLDRPGFS